VELQRAGGHLLEPGGDRVAVLRPERLERLQDHQIERALQHVCFAVVSIRHANEVSRAALDGQMKERVGGLGETEWINTEGTGKTEIGTLVKPRVTRRGRVGAGPAGRPRVARSRCPPGCSRVDGNRACLSARSFVTSVLY